MQAEPKTQPATCVVEAPVREVRTEEQEERVWPTLNIHQFAPDISATPPGHPAPGKTATKHTPPANPATLQPGHQHPATWQPSNMETDLMLETQQRTRV